MKIHETFDSAEIMFDDMYDHYILYSTRLYMTKMRYIQPWIKVGCDLHINDCIKYENEYYIIDRIMLNKNYDFIEATHIDNVFEL